MNQQQQQQQRKQSAKPQQCQDAEGCPAPADFTYVWPDSGTQYAGCTRHAYKAAAVVGNMGRVLELLPIDGGPAVKLGDSLGGVPAGAPAPSSDELERTVRELSDRVGQALGRADELERRVSELERSAAARTLTNPKDGPPTQPEPKK